MNLFSKDAPETAEEGRKLLYAWLAIWAGTVVLAMIVLSATSMTMVPFVAAFLFAGWRVYKAYKEYKAVENC